MLQQPWGCSRQCPCRITFPYPAEADWPSNLSRMLIIKGFWMVLPDRIELSASPLPRETPGTDCFVVSRGVSGGSFFGARILHIAGFCGFGAPHSRRGGLLVARIFILLLAMVLPSRFTSFPAVIRAIG